MVDEVTEVVPSPVVETEAVKPPPSVPDAGRLEMTGVVGVSGVPWLTEKVVDPVAPPSVPVTL